MSEELEPYKTSDTPFAAYLHMRGMALLSTIPDESSWKRKVYVFIDEPERARYEQEFRDDVGGFWSYWCSLKVVQRKLHEK